MELIQKKPTDESRILVGAAPEERWYVLRTVSEKEQQAVGLLERAVPHELWTYCRVLRKTKVFRSGGRLYLLEELMFPGYLFIKTAYPEDLARKLETVRKFPQIAGRKTGSKPPGKAVAHTEIIPVEMPDLVFLQNICGEELQKVMGVTRISLGQNNRITRADGVLENYLDKVVKLNLRKRFAIVEVELFNRRQEVLFGLWLEKDRAENYWK